MQQYRQANVPLHTSTHFLVMDLRPRYRMYPSTIAPTVTQNSLIACFLFCCAECDGIQPLDAKSIAPAAETIPYSWQEMSHFMSFPSNVSCVETSTPNAISTLTCEKNVSSFHSLFATFPKILHDFFTIPNTAAPLSARRYHILQSVRPPEVPC